MNLLLVATHEYLALNAIQCLHQTTDKIYVLGTKNTLPLKFSRRTVGFTLISESRLDTPTNETVEQIREFCKRNKIEAILTADLQGTIFLSKMGSATLATPLFPTDSVDKLTALHNKWTFYKILLKSKLPHPKTFLIKRKNDLKKVKIAYPAILKPLDRQGAEGVKKVDSREDAIRYLSKESKFSTPPLLLQEYLDGFDIGVSVLAIDGRILAWTMQKTLIDKSIVFFQNHRILMMVKKLIKMQNYTGLAHIDMFTTGKKHTVKILEFNPRVWGTILGSKFAHVNFLRMGVMIALGRKHLKAVQKPIRYITTRNFFLSLFTRNSFAEYNFHILRKSDSMHIVSDPIPYILCFVNELIK